MALRSLPLLENPPAAVPVFSDVPRDVSIEITGRCNLRCRHCFNESGPGHAHELPLATIEALLDEAKAWDVPSLRISGGEPTVHRHFREVIEACRRRGLAVGLNSNGVYAPALLEYLKTAPIEVFFISIDGLEANNDAIRGRGTFRHAVHSCRQLKGAGRKVVIGFHVGEGNRGDVPGMVELAAGLGVDLKVAPLRPVGRAARELPRSLIQPRNFYEVIRQLTRLRRRYPHVHVYTDFDLLEGPAAQDCAPDPGRASCKAGRTLLNVRPDGALTPCAFFDDLGEEFTAGNVHRESATAVWRRPTTFAAFRLQQKSGTCQGCGHYQRRCNGGCPAIAYSATGHVDAFDPTCFADLIEPETFGELGASSGVDPLPFALFVTPPEGGAP